MGAMESGSSRGGSTKMSLASQLNPGKREKSGNGQKLWAPASLQSSETVVVAIDATKAVTKHALEWALTNAVQPGDRIILLALIPLPSSSGWKLWSLQRLSSECASGLKSQKEAEDEAKDCCRHLLKQLQKHCDAKKIQVAVKIAYAAAKGSTAVEAQKIQATWIVVDRHLRKEVKHCMKKLQCNLVMIDRYNSKILRLNLKRSPGAPNFSFENASTPSDLLFPLPNAKTGATVSKKYQAAQNGERTAYTVSGTPLSSPEMGTPFTTTEHGVTTSTSSSEPGTSPHSSTEPGAFVNSIKGNGLASLRESIGSGISTEIETASENGYRVSDSENESPLCTATDASPEQNFGTPSLKISSFRKTQPPIGNRRASAGEGSIRCPLDGDNFERNESSYDRNNFDKRRPSHARLSSSTREGGSQNREPQNSLRSVMSPLTMPSLNIKADKNAPSQKLTIADLLASVKSTSKRRIMENQPRKATLILDRQKLYPEAGACISNDITFERTSSLRKAMSLTRHNPPGPPPLCSICQHKAPMFGKPPRVFTYSELELATGGFSNANFLAEGGFGSVHRGVLPDGQAVAVKQHKLASSQGDVEFCSEVEVLSCAQHRNVVMLIGYCIEGSRRLLVYEFICNGSLDVHLYGRGWNPLEWHSRHKIAIGAARGLRYLHEECRVGCIVHRDMRPNNILLTHDFEPMVGDFGLARWQPDGELGVETRVIGTFGYLAPEYAQSGQITEKADVYSFGVVLLELVTGRKAIDISRPKGEQCLTEWARPLLEEQVFHNMVDPRIEDCYNEHEVRCMLHAASLCIRQDPQLRPRMSQVLRILEGDVALDMGNSPTSSGSIRLSFDKFPVINSGYVSRLSLSNSSSERIRQSTELRRSGSSTPNLRANRPRTSFDRQGSQFSKLDGPIRKLSYEDLRTTYKDKAGF